MSNIEQLIRRCISHKLTVVISESVRSKDVKVSITWYSPLGTPYESKTVRGHGVAEYEDDLSNPLAVAMHKAEMEAEKEGFFK